MPDTNLSDRDGRRVNPAEADLQIQIRNKLDRLLNGPASDAHEYTMQKLTINGSGVAEGLPEACKLVRLSHANANPTYLSINTDGEDATAEDWLIPASEVVVLPIVNASQIHVAGTAADVVHLLIAK